MVRGLRCDAAADAGAAGGLYSCPCPAQRQGMLSGYRTLPLNSLARQRQDLALLNAAAPAVTAALQNAGLKTVDADLSAMPVTVDDWLASPASEGWRLLWLTLPGAKAGAGSG